MSRRRRISAAAAAAVLVALAGCGATTKQAVTTPTPDTISVPAADKGQLTIYASVKLTGPEANPWLADAMQLALEQAGGRVDRIPVRLVVLDETPSGVSNPDVVSAIAATAAADPSTMAFIGSQSSGDTALSLPILNRAGILEVSPTATYGGLTRSSQDRAEPAKYYPTSRRTFGRVVPSDTAQAAAQVAYVRSAGCNQVYVLDDKGLYGRGLSAAFVSDAKRSGVNIAGTRGIATDAEPAGSLVSSVASAAGLHAVRGLGGARRRTSVRRAARGQREHEAVRDRHPREPGVRGAAGQLGATDPSHRPDARSELLRRLRAGLLRGLRGPLRRPAGLVGRSTATRR